MAVKTVTLRLDPELHKKLRMKLLVEDKTFQEIGEQFVKEYVESKKETDTEETRSTQDEAVYDPESFSEIRDRMAEKQDND